MASLDYTKDKNAFSFEFAQKLDAQDPLRHLRNEFIIPTRGEFRAPKLSNGSTTHSHDDNDDNEAATYLCGNSLGLQPKCTKDYVTAQLSKWGRQVVTGHFTPSVLSSKGPLIPPWVDIDDAPKEPMAALVGAMPSEVAVMETLTANLHLLMAAFYRPDTSKSNGERTGRYKIILEEKAFPSDHYAVESQLRHHGLSPEEAMVLIKPPSDTAPLMSTEHILATIDAHASTTALLLLPGVQFYTGQCFDMKKITAHAQSKGIVVGWDLAHAVGNVEMNLHDWNIDFAVWCTYKYLNCGPGAVGALFVHDRHCPATTHTNGAENTNGNGGSAHHSSDTATPALTGWWGSTKRTRFAMTNTFEPIPGASQFQLSNPSALDLSAVLASMSIFSQTSVSELRARSLRLTGYLEHLLLNFPGESKPFRIITPRKPEDRGAQLSILLEPGLLETVMEVLMEKGVVTDERKPDVVRVAPAPLYNNAQDCWRFVSILLEACKIAQEKKGTANGKA